MKASWVTKGEFSRAMQLMERRFAQIDQRIDDRQSELAEMIKAVFDDLSTQFKSHSRVIDDHERRLAVVEYALAIPKK